MQKVLLTLWQGYQVFGIRMYQVLARAEAEEVAVLRVRSLLLLVKKYGDILQTLEGKRVDK